MTAEEFERRFDDGESVFDLGVSKTGWHRPGLDALEAPQGEPTTDPPAGLHIRIGRLKGEIWTALFTCRGEAIRILCVRRATQDEEALYRGQP